MRHFAKAQGKAETDPLDTQVIGDFARSFQPQPTPAPDQVCRELTERLLKAGKLKKVALTAVMRKLLICLNTLLRKLAVPHPSQQGLCLQSPSYPTAQRVTRVQEKKRNKYRRPSAALLCRIFSCTPRSVELRRATF